MTSHDIEGARARLEARVDDLGGHYGEAQFGRWVDEVKVADLRAILADRSRLLGQNANLSGVLEWIANHRNDGLTDGSAATRACLDEIVNLAAAAITPTQNKGR
jgi:hypothetical protein